LIALVHISDLHFAHEWFSRAQRTPTNVNPTQSIIPTPGGLGAHDIGACEDLENALQGIAATWKVQNKRPDFKLLVVTGDLTVCGDDSEFVLALTYLRETIVDAWRSGIGLGKIGFDDVLVIPGNHDHWGGAYRFLYSGGTPPSIHGTYFPTAANKTWWFREFARSTGPVLQLMGIDTCAGRGARFFARSHRSQ
jgi:3',5'-cyclic AMP phosphodiesterase CpdA